MGKGKGNEATDKLAWTLQLNKKKKPGQLKTRIIKTGHVHGGRQARDEPTERASRFVPLLGMSGLRSDLKRIGISAS
jgi:hypothetical protein